MVSARLGCVDGRAILVADSLDKYIDIEKFSGGKLPSEPMACIELWSEVCSLAASLELAKATICFKLSTGVGIFDLVAGQRHSSA